MLPADEYISLAALIEAGQPVEAVAIRFGVSEKHVRQRLRLGKVAPELLDAFRGGALSLAALTAFARRRSSGAARGVAPGQGPELHLSPYRAAPVDPERRPARLASVRCWSTI
jgi:hypothetical protein